MMKQIDMAQMPRKELEKFAMEASGEAERLRAVVEAKEAELRLLRKEKFAGKSEKSRNDNADEAQLSFFNDAEAIVHEYGDKIILNPGIMFPEYDGMELTEEEKRRILDDEIFSICKGGAYIPDMWDYNFYDTFVQMVAERPDFYEKAENCILP